MAKLFVAAIVCAAILDANRVGRTQEVSTPVSPATTEAAVASDLQGRWKLRAAQVGGEDKFGKSAEEKLSGLTLTVDGRELRFEDSSGGSIKGRLLEVSPGDGVTTVDFTTSTTKRFGIYKVDGKKLQICFSTITPPKAAFRPHSFRGEDLGADHMLLKFLRVEAEP